MDTKFWVGMLYKMQETKKGKAQKAVKRENVR